MSSSVESRVVTMKFDNSGFERAVAITLQTLQKLKDSLNFSKSKKGLDDLQNAGNRFNMQNVGNAADGISGRFLAMSTVAITALANIADRAVDSGIRLVKAFTIDPITTGLHEYEQTLEATQTIMSATGESVGQVTKTLQELNKYSDQTIFSFSDMTSNIKYFTNAGLSSEKAARVMKGIANAAAAAGANAEAAGRAMFGFGQAMSMGFVGLQDWNQIDNAGLATKEFKEELILAGLAAGTLTKSADGTIKTLKGSEVTFKNLRGTLQDQWLTSEALVATLDKYSDVSTKVGKKASENATRIKSLSQLMGVLKETVQSGWAETWLEIFGNLEEASMMWTNVNDAVGGFLQHSAEVRNKVIGDWRELGGQVYLLDGIRNVFQAIGSVLKPIKEAFRDIFPAKTGADLAEMSKNFQAFTENLKISDTTAADLKRTFRGVFAIFSIIGKIISGVASGFGILFGAVKEGSGGFFEFTGDVGDLIVRFDRFLEKTGAIEIFFQNLGRILAVPIKLLGLLGAFLAGLFEGFESSDTKALDQGLQRVGDRLDFVADAGDRVFAFFRKIGQIAAPIVEKIGEAFSGVGEAIVNAFSDANFDKTIDILNTVLLGGLLIAIQRFFSRGLNIDFGGGFVSGITDSFGALTDTMKAMQTQIQAKTLLLIASAIALLTASVVALSLIDSERLQTALGAMGVGFAQLLAAMAILVKISGAAGFVKVPIIAASMVLMATAVLILTGALAALSQLNWEELAKGLTGVAGLLAALAGAAYLFSLSSGGILRAGIAMIPLAIGIKILASAVGDFSTMSWEEIGKGLTGMAGALALVAAAMYLMPATAPLIGAGLVIFGAGLRVVADAVMDFSEMSWKEMGKGMAGLAGALAIIAAAMYLLPPTMVITAAGLVLVGIALQSIGKAVGKMGSMSWEEIGKGLTVLAASLAILAAGLIAMTGTLLGSAALLIAAAALAILTPVLVTLGSLSWEAIAKGMVTLAGAFTILGLAGLILTPLAPAIVALSLSLLAVGAGMALAGAGALAFATAFSLFVAAATAGIGVTGALIALIPKFLTSFAQGIIDFAKTIGEQAGIFIAAFGKLLDGILNAVIKYTPKVAKAFIVLVQNGLKVIRATFPDVADTGLDMLIVLLKAVERNIYRITTIAIDIVLKFLKAIGDRHDEIADAGAKLVIKFINGTAEAIRDNDEQLVDAAQNLGEAIIGGVVSGIDNVGSDVVDALLGVAESGLSAIKKKLKIGSPSKVFRDQVGKEMVAGVAWGISRNARMIDRPMRQLTAQPVRQLQASIANAVKNIERDPHVHPTIRPVLDLTKLQSQATQIGTLLRSRPITVAEFTRSRAAALAASIAENREKNIEDKIEDINVGRGRVSFTQNNYSPKAIDPITTYRNGKSLISLAKKELNVA